MEKVVYEHVVKAEREKLGGGDEEEKRGEERGEQKDKRDDEASPAKRVDDDGSAMLDEAPAAPAAASPFVATSSVVRPQLPPPRQVVLPVRIWRFKCPRCLVTLGTLSSAEPVIKALLFEAVSSPL